MRKRKTSLRMGLLTVILICWLVPLMIIMTLAGALLQDSYQDSVNKEIETSAENALQQVKMQLDGMISDSKAVSYDGVIRSTYRTYQQDGNIAVLYRGVNSYLTQNFSREELYKVVFICFWDEGASGASAYLLNSGTTGSELLRKCQSSTPQILEAMASADTDIRFLTMDGQLYMARNLLDSSFVPYASVVMLLDGDILFRPLDGISRIRDMQLHLDECCFLLNEQREVVLGDATQDYQVRYETEADGHAFSFTANLVAYDLWAENPWMYWAIGGIALLVIPLLGITIGLFSHHVTRPIETLAKANLLVQSGKRGYQINEEPPNLEFSKLYDHFDAMSTELNRQFEQSYLEQQATQKAQIKALQSQINPHFLNNTLEIINWEARLADNERVCAMIEALSTMLDAALDRDGRTQIFLKEELGYVDAYLYIIRERLGDRFCVHKEIDEAILEKKIPRLILQPIVENAVEHDITRRRGGNLWVRAYCRDGCMVLDVEHDGTMTDADRENIRRLLQETTSVRGSVGLENVSQRLRLLYGQQGSLSISETEKGTILARVSFPID